MSDDKTTGGENQQIPNDKSDDVPESDRMAYIIAPPQTQPETASQSQNTDRDIEKRMSAFESSMRRLTITGIIIAGISGLIFLGQLYQMYSASRLDQRAWVGVTNILNVSMEAQKPISFLIVMSNSGKTPALHAHVKVAAQGQSGLFFNPNYTPSTTRDSDVTIQPGAQMALPSPADKVLPQADIDAVTAGTTVAYIYGKITYNDIFGREHHTTFCAIVLKDLHSWQWSDEYNYAD